MNRTAILIDGGWFTKAIEKNVQKSKMPHGVTADIIYRNALATVDSTNDQVVKVFYYDSIPHEKKETNPISRISTDYSTTAAYHARKRLFRELGAKDMVALRRGVVRPRGWTLHQEYITKLLAGHITPPTAKDVFLNFEQKGVDMRIGIDVSSLATKKLVDKIYLLSGDTDMIPAIKFARREGVQIVVINVPGRKLHPEIIEDADFCRNFVPIV